MNILPFTLYTTKEPMLDDLWLDADLIRVVILDEHKNEEGHVDKIAIIHAGGVKFNVYDEERDTVERWKAAMI